MVNAVSNVSSQTLGWTVIEPHALIWPCGKDAGHEEITVCGPAQDVAGRPGIFHGDTNQPSDV